MHDVFAQSVKNPCRFYLHMKCAVFETLRYNTAAKKEMRENASPFWFSRYCFYSVAALSDSKSALTFLISSVLSAISLISG